jgi:hypothetical protein
VLEIIQMINQSVFYEIANLWCHSPPKKAGYIDADSPSFINFSLAFRRRTKHSGKFDLQAGSACRTCRNSRAFKALIAL